MAKHAGGRPTVLTEEVLRKLEEAFLVDATYAEAAIYAGISETALYDYKKEYPEYTERVDKLRGMTGLKAKINIRNAIDEGSAIDSKWHLERRDPDYKPKSSQDVKLGASKSLLDAIIEGRKAREGKE